MTLIHNVDLEGTGTGWLTFNQDSGLITGTGTGAPDTQLFTATPVSNIIDGGGCLLMPGAIDCHVHFRDPGLTHKGDMATESAAAIAGGVTSVIDMPNTVPQTVTRALCDGKLTHASQVCTANYGVFIGATNDNLSELLEADYSRIAGVKLFLGSSTGNMLVNNADALRQLFSSVRVPICIHAEDEATIARNRAAARARFGNNPVPVEWHSKIRSEEACIRATAFAISLAEETGARIHIAHVTTAREVEMAGDARARGVRVSCEVSPIHLTFCTDDYPRLGTRIKINPAVKGPDQRSALRSLVRAGQVDMFATDHAPHLLSEKQGDANTAVSGAPIIQFALPLLLSTFDTATVASMYCRRPAEIYGIAGRGRLQPGYAADLVMLRHTAPYTVGDSDVVSRCVWTPLDQAVPLTWRVERVWLNGHTPNVNAARPLAFSR